MLVNKLVFMSNQDRLNYEQQETLWVLAYVLWVDMCGLHESLK